MTSGLSKFAARLREFAAVSLHKGSHSGGAANEPDFGNLALELFALQFDSNPTYRNFCKARGATPQSVLRWTQIPAAPTTAFKEFELTCLPASERTTVFHSSGTSQERPSRHFHNAGSLALYETLLWPWFRSHVLPDLERVDCPRLAILTPPPSEVPHSSLVHMFEVVRRELAAGDHSFVGCVAADGAWTLDFDNVFGTLQEACDTETPLVLLGTAFSFVHLLDWLARQQLRFELPAGSRVMETGGYKGRSRELSKSELHVLIGQRLGIPTSHIVCEYGMSELSSQAYDLTIHCSDTVLPHPGPLPTERENYRQSADESPLVGKIESQTLLSPLPSGEGQGEGKRSVHRSEAARFFRFPPWARVQIISPETGCEVADGETGLIRIFDLANAFSVLAIQTEDLGIRRADGFELLGRAANLEPRGCSLMAINS